MKKKIFNYLKLAASIAQKKTKMDRRCFLLGAVGIRSDGALISAINGSSKYPNRHAHAEKRALSMLNKGSIMFVARMKAGDGTLAIARPCPSCMKAIKSKRIKKVYYSISENEFGVISFNYKSSIRIKETTKWM